MILYIASFFIFIFVSLNLFLRASCPLWIKLLGSLLVLLVSLKYEIYQVIGGAFFAPQLPRTLLLALEAAYGALILLFFLLLLWDLYLLGNWLLAKAGFPIPSHLPAGAIKTGLVVFAIALGCWGTYQAIRVPEPRTITLEIPNLPKNLEGFSLAQLTDLHIGPILKKDWLSEVVARTNALEPDLILLTGDYVDGYVNELAGELEPLASLQSKYGVWGVTGNHEYYWDMRAWQKTLENYNIKMLENEHHIFDINGETIVLAGIPDLAAARFGMPEPNLDKALAGAPKALTILLSHQPRNAASFSPNADLILSGHTHGGLMFFLQPLIARFNSGFVNGMYPMGNNNIYVSPGTGLWNGFSSRIGVPSEITNIILKRAQ